MLPVMAIDPSIRLHSMHKALDADEVAALMGDSVSLFVGGDTLSVGGRAGWGADIIDEPPIEGTIVVPLVAKEDELPTGVGWPLPVSGAGGAVVVAEPNGMTDPAGTGDGAEDAEKGEMVSPVGNVLPVVAFNGKKVDPGGKVLSADLFGGGRNEISADAG